ncbi:alcohol dehydrogenase catalytic domain-containing protein [Castellaniella sp.]|uniref:alcohol dehydrogenase catalytic domain-containing protein n=1 Tax=Castellaniella sp. TaxID=1955812 RepID=UPI00356972F7
MLEVRACGVCHSDVHLHDGYFDLGGGKRLDMTQGIPLPRTLGHEIVAKVVRVGPDCADVKPGSSWLIYPWIGCGQCSVCRVGDEHLCVRPRALGIGADGGFSNYVRVPHPRYLVDYGSLPEHLACTYACSGLTAFSALKKAAPVSQADPLMIIGAGGVGQSAIRLAGVLYDLAPTVVERDADKRQAALALGAEMVLDPGDRDAAKAHLKENGGYATVIDFVGSESSVNYGLGMLRKGGKLIVVGLFGGKIELALPLLPLRPISILGSYVGSLPELHELLAMAREKSLPAIDIQTHPLSAVSGLLSDLKDGQIRGRAVVLP